MEYVYGVLSLIFFGMIIWTPYLGMCLGVFIGTCIINVIQLTNALSIPTFRLGSEIVTIDQFIPSIPFSFIAVYSLL